MALQINPSKIPIWVGDNKLRLGLDDRAQLLENLTNSQERLIHLLFEGIANDQVNLIGHSVGLADAETSELVDRLLPSLTAQSVAKSTSSSIDVRFAELIRIGFETNTSPAEVLQNRAKWLVELPCLDRSGLTILRALCELGFRRFETEDYALVASQDGGELGYPKSLNGYSRIVAAKGLIESTKSKVSLNYMGSKRSQKRLRILSGTHHLFPTAYEALQHPHVAVEYRVDSLFVSSIVLPGKTPCLGCRARWQSEHDSNWANQSIQLTGRGDQLDDGASLLITSALVAKQVCSFIDFDQCGTNLRIDLNSRQISESSIQWHPNCRCEKLKGNQ